jgi:mono/diheme cytochrome c family protein
MRHEVMIFSVIISYWRNITLPWMGGILLAFVLLAASGKVLAGEAEDSDVVDYGAYLARVGNCMGCHTTKGGQPFAGGAPLVHVIRCIYYTQYHAR